MVSGLHPLRATKVRYHEDPQFQKRIFKPLKQQQFSCPRARILVGAPTPCALDRTACHSAAKHGDPNGRLRREPELPQHEEIEKAPLAEHEFDAGSVSPTQMRSRHKR